jgi:soluble lytic murein transglycosylase-like protein
MKSILIVAEMLCTISIGWAQSGRVPTRIEADYYVTAYARHYRVPVALARAIVMRESNWQPCPISAKGAVGLMQLMPATAKRLGVTDRCNADQNVSGGVRYLAWLMRQFHNDLRLVAAASETGCALNSLSRGNNPARYSANSLAMSCFESPTNGP